MTNRARILLALVTFAALTIAPLACTHAPPAPATREALPLQIAPIPDVPHATAPEPSRRVDPADGICVESVTAFTGARIDCEHGATAALDRSVADHPVVRCVCDNNGGRSYQMALGSDVTEPIRIVTWSQMLYPQDGGYFARQISPKTWAWLQEEARRLLATEGSYAHPHVVAHWKSIVAGQVPFGFSVESYR
jgi:hypothetical protein